MSGHLHGIADFEAEKLGHRRAGNIAKGRGWDWLLVIIMTGFSRCFCVARKDGFEFEGEG